MEGDSFDDWPAACARVGMRVEKSGEGFWCYYDGRRSAGSVPEVPLHETLKWVLEQLNLGFCKYGRDQNGDIVSLIIGRGAPHGAASAEEAAQQAGAQGLALSLVGAVAEAREKGSAPEITPFLTQVLGAAKMDMKGRMEIHYALVLARLLGRVSKKMTKLEILPVAKDAPEAVKNYIAEATRCYLLKLDRACVALCRACLEDTLRGVLDQKMQQEWKDEVAENRRQRGSPDQMHALSQVCPRNGKLKGYEKAAHDVREAGNRILHLKPRAGVQRDEAEEVLRKSRSIIGLIYGQARGKGGVHREAV
jgi:hypothetical protein